MAFHVSGSFSGIVHADALPLPFPPPRPIGYYDGAAVNGTFSVNLVAPHFQVGGDGYAYFVNGDGGAFSLSYDIRDEHFSYSADHSVIELRNPAGPSGMQSATFLTDFMPKYLGGWFDLIAPPDSLFSGLDVNTLHLDPGATPIFKTSFADAPAGIRVEVEVGAVHFDAAPVPEPSTVTMLLVGCVLMACFAKMRSR
jgi:hypothetical protein